MSSVAKRLLSRKTKNFTFWGCSICSWFKPLPRTDKAEGTIPAAVEREFDKHNCSTFPRQGTRCKGVTQVAEGIEQAKK